MKQLAYKCFQIYYFEYVVGDYIANDFFSLIILLVLNHNNEILIRSTIEINLYKAMFFSKFKFKSTSFK